MTECQPRISPHKGTCSCCRRETLGFVVSSSVGPMSDFYCQECLNSGAEPEWGLEYLYSWVGTKGEGLADHVRLLKTYKDDKYWTWDEWIAWRRSPEIAPIMDMHLEAEIEDMNRAEDEMRRQEDATI